MLPRIFLCFLLMLSCSWALGCDDGESDGDADADGDADSDGDLDADEDFDGSCLRTDQPGCGGELLCCDQNESCAGPEGEAPRCVDRCQPGGCSYGEQPGTCIDYGVVAVCQPTGALPVAVTCANGSRNCTTEYGASAGTICVADSVSGSTFCFETCTVGETGCDEEHACVSNESGGGVCMPLGE